MNCLDSDLGDRRRLSFRFTPTFFGFLFVLLLLGLGRASSLQAAVGDTCGVQPVNICLMLDRTGSVSSTELANERAFAKVMVDNIAGLANGTRVAVGRFGDNTDGTPEAEIKHSLDTNYAQAKADIDTFLSSNSSVGTNVRDAINVCQTHLTNNNNGKQNIIVLLSDFDPSEPTNPDSSALTAATNAKNAGTRIFAIGFDVIGESSADEINRALGASIASGTALDDHCTATNCDHSGTDEITDENTDGDDWFLALTISEFGLVLDKIFSSIQCVDDGNHCTEDTCDANTNKCVSNPIDSCIPCENDGQCDDNNPCTSDSCDLEHGRCKYDDNDGASCDDGDGCTEDEKCEGGTCQAGDPKVCDDDRSCSTDQCLSPSGQCDFNLENCECNSDEDCNDGNTCTDDVCDLDTGICSNRPDDENSCNDKDACTSGDHCDAGQCVGSPVTCNDNKACTDDSCDPATGCKFTNDDENACTDNDGCTDGDHCDDGACVPGGPKNCSDHRSCSVDQCVSPGGSCDHDLSDCECDSDEDCNDGNACTDDSCIVDSGTCVNEPNDQNACSDGNACTSGDHCSTGDCVGSLVTCNDDNSCTDDSCNEETGCVFLNNDENTCSDDDGCTAGDQCVSGACVPGDPKVCDDHRACSTNDHCVSPSGDCDFDLSQCKCEVPADCDDNSPCTDDLCNTETGACTNVSNGSCSPTPTGGGDCPNGTCGAGETCGNCPEDCGACTPPPPSCGNGTCDQDETCGNCPDDCGECPNSCGNGVCDSGEDCNCPDCAETDTCRITAQKLKCAQNLVAESNGKISAQQAEALADELVNQGEACSLLLEGQSTIGGCAFQVDSRNTQLSWMGLACVVFGWAPIALRRVKVRRRR